MKITPWILGTGQAGQAAAKSLASLALLQPEFGIQPVRWLERSTTFATLATAGGCPLLVISNPHGLHTQAILAAAAAGIQHIVTESLPV